MATVKKPPGGKRGEVTADDVVAAAIDIVDREGVDAVTIRRVAEACGPSPMAAPVRRQDRGEAMKRRSPLGGVTVSFFDFGPQIPCPIGEEHMIVIGKGSMIRPDALTPHIIDDEMRVLGELKAEGVVRSAYRRSEGPGFYLLAEGPSIDAVRERIDNTLPFVVENLATVEYDAIYEI
jgi:hypothetical protein